MNKGALLLILAFIVHYYPHLLLWLSAGALILALYLIVYQESLLYIPVIMGIKTPEQNPEGLRKPSEQNLEFTEAMLQTTDHQQIHTWFIPSSSPSTTPTIIFCHENAGNMGLRLQEFQLFNRFLSSNLIAFDYRGYGLSSGTPSQDGLIEDTMTVLRYAKTLVDNKTISNHNIFLFGRSLGGAVGIHVAALESHPVPIQGLIAANTFTCISDMLDSVFPILSWSFVKRYLLRLKWMSIQEIQKIRMPVLLLSSINDEIVPAWHMKQLQSKLSPHELHQFHTFEIGTHNDTWLPSNGGTQYWNSIKRFMEQCLTKTK